MKEQIYNEPEIIVCLLRTDSKIMVSSISDNSFGHNNGNDLDEDDFI